MSAMSVSNGVKPEYLLDNSWIHACERLAILEHWADPNTIHHLEKLWVDPLRRTSESGILAPMESA
jgi:hypothetical protein